MKPKKGDFWIFNISKFNVNLADLRITIKAGKHLNLLSGNNPYTIGQLEQSLQNGSIAAKSQFIKITRVKPVFNIPKPEPLPTEIRITRVASIIHEEDDILPELQLLDSMLPEEDEEGIIEKNK